MRITSSRNKNVRITSIYYQVSFILSFYFWNVRLIICIQKSSPYYSLFLESILLARFGALPWVWCTMHQLIKGLDAQVYIYTNCLRNTIKFSYLSLWAGNNTIKFSSSSVISPPCCKGRERQRGKRERDKMKVSNVYHKLQVYSYTS